MLRRDRKLADLFYGRKPIAGLRDQSRSGREMSLVCKLRWFHNGTRCASHSGTTVIPNSVNMRSLYPQKCSSKLTSTRLPVLG